MKLHLMGVLACMTLIGLATQARAQFLLGTAADYAVLAGSAVTNTGPTILTGNLGVWPGTAVTGFPPGILTLGSIHAGDASAQQAQSDLTVAYNTVATEAFNTDLTGQDMGGMTLTPGVYHFDSSAFLTGTLTLDALGNPNARFDFQIGSTLITAPNAIVRMINDNDSCDVYWQVGSSATLDTGTTFKGHVMALASITMNTNATIIEGSALARNGAVTLDTNTITACLVPEPGSILAVCVGLALLAVKRRKD